MKFSHLLLFTICIVFLYSCTQKSFDSKDELWEFLRNDDNEYLHKKSVNGYDFSLLYKPTDILVDQELRDKYSEKEIQNLRNKYSQYLYFTLSISRGNKELLSTAPKNRQEFGAMVNQLAFGMGKKVHVFTPQKDTLELLDYVYPRMYGMSKSTSMLFVYPRDNKFLQEEYLNITIEDLGTYTGEVKFKIPTRRIKNEPKLKFK